MLNQPWKLTEEDTKNRYVTPALQKVGWDAKSYRMEYRYTDGKIEVREGQTIRGKAKKVDYLLYGSSAQPIAVIEAKDTQHQLADGLQQGIDYATDLNVPFVYATNGTGFYEHDLITGAERELELDDFPTPDELKQRYYQENKLTESQIEVMNQPFYFSSDYNRIPRYYQQVAVNKTVEAIAGGQKRVLLVMATGTGKTFTAFQIVHRLKRAGLVKRVLYLADRNILIDQTLSQDFKPFEKVAVKVEDRRFDSAYEIYFSLYQQASDKDNEYYRQLAPDFFDLIIVDECHRSSARDDSNWHAILEYFGSAAQIGMTATPKETMDVSNIGYFGEPIYTYSLKQGIEDGYLAPYEVVRVSINKDVEGYRPEAGKLDVEGMEIDDREYTMTDFDKNIVIDERTKLVAERITEFLKTTDRMARTIVFCVDTEHALRMRNALAQANQDMVRQNPDYVVRITGNDKLGMNKLDDFVDKNTKYPVIATTSMLLSTGVDTKTVKLIVLEKSIGSMTEFKQIIGRGTRLALDKGKSFFTIMDFRQNAKKFADDNFDGVAEMIRDVDGNGDITAASSDTVAAQLDRKYDTGGVTQAVVAEGAIDSIVVHRKVRINGVDVKIIDDHVEYFGPDGKLITENAEDFSRRHLLAVYPSKDDFLHLWFGNRQKADVMAKLAEAGVMVPHLWQEYGYNHDIFDILLKVGYGMELIVDTDRVNKVKNSDFYHQLADNQRQIVDALLQTYAESGIIEMQNRKLLATQRFKQLGGGANVILRNLGGVTGYNSVMDNIERLLYS